MRKIIGVCEVNFLNLQQKSYKMDNAKKGLKINLREKVFTNPYYLFLYFFFFWGVTVIKFCFKTKND